MLLGKCSLKVLIVATHNSRNINPKLDFDTGIRFIPVGTPILNRGLKSWVLVPLRVFTTKYLQLHTTWYLLAVLQSIEWHIIYTAH